MFFLALFWKNKGAALHITEEGTNPLSVYQREMLFGVGKLRKQGSEVRLTFKILLIIYSRSFSLFVLESNHGVLDKRGEFSCLVSGQCSYSLDEKGVHHVYRSSN